MLTINGKRLSYQPVGQAPIPAGDGSPVALPGVQMNEQLGSHRHLVQNRARPGATEAYANIEAGNEGYRMVEGALNLPVGETAGLRLATRLKTRDGSVENLLGGEDLFGAKEVADADKGSLPPMRL